MQRGNFDPVAEWYDARVRADELLHDLALPALYRLAGDVQGKRLLDVACGQGVAARGLAEMGASVVGVDIAEALLTIARVEEGARPLGIDYHVEDAQSLASLTDGSFDAAVCNMALINIPDLAAACIAIRRVLRPGGAFVFSITHPCFQTSRSSWTDEEPPRRAVGAYFHEGWWLSSNTDGVRGKIGDEHRTLSTYINTLTRAGLLIDEIAEPRANARVATFSPGYREVPALLVVRCIATQAT